MKVNLLGMALCLNVLLLGVACSPKTASTAAKTDAVTTANPLEKGKKKFPDLTIVEVEKGQALYAVACTKCHYLYAPEGRNDKQWAHVLEEMFPKTKLSAEEKNLVERYVYSYSK